MNACISFHEITKAGDAVAALKNSLKPTAIVYRDGKWDHGFDATKLVPGDLVELALGAVVPAGLWGGFRVLCCVFCVLHGLNQLLFSCRLYVKFW